MENLYYWQMYTGYKIASLKSANSKIKFQLTFCHKRRRKAEACVCVCVALPVIAEQEGEVDPGYNQAQ